jgi:glycine betaine/proline transport system permease protein
MLSLSMVVIAALVGANGLGVPVVRALNSVNTALGFESGFIIVVVAILLDRMLRVTRDDRRTRRRIRPRLDRLRRPPDRALP